ncbi:Transcription factor [Cordyceps fumosorosea ARSEF 2679]|uniref:Transcription factor n=1 Tax=Cordyceps fumosorosea (strain ARSEF 2679) TaxID=1081104 RepID=A0A167J1E3_CORFA|nr:Transcription factor [Cordyceps fumosorosea ARSEF 2679]OAA49687.1 Transcription factor [Cordyceps fumosorosea ARSEF 2679]
MLNAAAFLATVLALSLTAVSAPTNQTQPDAGLSKAARLRLADSFAERYSILTDDKDFVFDLGQNNFQSIANPQTFPAMVGTGTSIAAARFPGCSISKLHIHPRAAEMLVLLSGYLVTETIPELGAGGSSGGQRVIRTEMASPGALTVFDQGALHTQINPDCGDATALTVFSAEDGGFGFVADQAFALPDDVLATQLGDAISGADIDRIRAALPAGVAAMVDACVEKCKIPKRSLSLGGTGVPEQTRGPGNDASDCSGAGLDESLPMPLRQRLLQIFTQTHHMLELCACVDMDLVQGTAAPDKDSFLLQSILALSALYLTDVEATSDTRFANSKSLMFFFRSKAQELSRSLSDEPSGKFPHAPDMHPPYPSLTCPPTVVTIQANLVLGLCELLTMATSKAWLHIGLAIRMAQTLRMRREYNRRLVPRQREVRRRTFWACVMLDRLVAYCTHRTQTIDLSLIQLHLPCSEVAFAFGHESPGPTISELADGASDMAADRIALAYFVRTFLLWSPVAQIYVDGGRGSQQSGQRKPVVGSAEYEAAMSAWRDSLPSEMQWSLRNLRAHRSLGQMSHFASMHLLIQHTAFLSHHEYLPHAGEGRDANTFAVAIPPSDSDAVTISICIEGANQVVAMLRLIDSITAGLCYTQLGVCAGIPMVTAASVLLWAHHCSRDATSSVQLSDDQISQAKHDVDYLVNVLDSWAKTWRLARAWSNCIRLLDEFYQSRYRRGNKHLKNGSAEAAELRTESESVPVSPTPLRDGDGYPDVTMIPTETYYKVRLITGLILEQPELCKKFLQASIEQPFSDGGPEESSGLWGFDIEDFSWMNDPDLVMAASALWNDFTL